MTGSRTAILMQWHFGHGSQKQVKPITDSSVLQNVLTLTYLFEKLLVIVVLNHFAIGSGGWRKSRLLEAKENQSSPEYCKDSKFCLKTVSIYFMRHA